MANLDTLNARLREHFSRNAADLITIHGAFGGPRAAQDIIMACFRAKRDTSRKINETTVLNVLQKMSEAK